jgi:diguanylate cyclase (GGDEF)-like protein/putative nucleotidyltransferase with HDIG domain
VPIQDALSAAAAKRSSLYFAAESADTARGMAGRRRRRDQIWNPPSRGVDISAIFVVFAAGPLLLPLIGAQLDVIAFATPLLFSAFATWRCALAARRSRPRRWVWVAFATATAFAMVASAIALADPHGDAPFYVGAIASAALVVATGELVRRSLSGAPRERIADGLLFPVLIIAFAAWFIVIPGFRTGDALLTGVVILDIVAVSWSALVLVGRPSAQLLHITAPLTLGIALATVGDSMISAGAAGDLSTSGLPTALLWAGASYLGAVAADFDAGELPPELSAADADIAPGRWVLARVVLPLVALVVIPLLMIALGLAGGLTSGAAAWFSSTFLVVLGLSFGRQAYLLLDNRRSVLRERELREEVMRRNEELEALTNLATTMTQTLEESPIVERGLGVLHLAARASSSALYALREEARYELAAAAGSWPSEHTWAGRPVSPGELPTVATRGGRQIIRLPLGTRGHDIGFVTLMRPGDDSLEDGDLQLLGLLAGQLAIAIQNARDYREKLEQAIRDPLTGLYNRRFFYEALEKEVQRTRRYGNTVSLVLFDVDNFKTINDTRGHQAGDDVLRTIGEIVSDLIRPVDSFARLGGEEFGLLLPETSQLDALLAAERLRTAISRHEILADRRVTISGGVASCPQDAATLEELESKADGALYWAKRNGKNICALASEVVVSDAGEDQAGSLAHLHALVTMIDAQHLQTRDHSENVAAYAVALGRACGLDGDHIVRLRLAALFHDIGKVAVSAHILNKKGPLNPDELAEIRTHPSVGATMLSHAGLHEEANWIRCHHEWVDGRGYPAGLVGDAIPLEARIILVADAFEAMTSDRPYSPGIAVEEALAELRACAGTQFDPLVVEALVGLVEKRELAVLALRNAQPDPR